MRPQIFRISWGDYINKQIRYSLGNIPSIPLGLFIIYALTQWGGLWYIFSSLVSFVIATAINFNVHRLQRIIFTKSKIDYASKLVRFYAGSAPLVPLGTSVLYVVTEYGHIFYLASVIVSMLCTTTTGMAIQTLLRVIRVKRHTESSPTNQ